MSAVSRNPDQGRIVGNAFVVLGIPILGAFEPGGMPIEKNKLRAVIVQTGVDIVLLSHAIGFAVVE